MSMNFKKKIIAIVFLAFFSATVLLSCGKQSNQAEPVSEQSDSTEHPSDSTEHPSDSTEHPSEHPADSTKN